MNSSQHQAYFMKFKKLNLPLLCRHKVAISDLSADYLYEDVYLRSWDLARAIAEVLPHEER